jgi:hypothetical protein
LPCRLPTQQQLLKTEQMMAVDSWMHQSTNQTKENAINRKLSYRKRRSGGTDLGEKTFDEDVSALADLRGLLWVGFGALEAWRRRSRPWTRSGDPRRC